MATAPEPGDQPQEGGTLLPFHHEIVRQMLDEDGICVMAGGLGLDKVLAALLHHHATEASGRPVLVLGASERQRQQVLQELGKSLEGFPLPVEVTNEVPSSERQVLYKSGVAVFVTTRIVVVDLLTSRACPADISGVIVCNAHKVKETSGEAFAARLFREGNSRGFMRALTDTPAHFSAGFNSVERVMKSLHLRRLFLYPRFHSQVKVCLEKRTIDVVELEQDPSPSMATIQEALITMIESCIKELNKTNRIDCTNLTRDNALSKSFDEIVRRQLDPVWNTVSRKTKQLVYDLKTLRQLADFSLRLDPVAFLSYLEALRASEGTRSLWLFLAPAHSLFESAKQRVFTLAKEGPAAAKKQRLEDSSGLAQSVAPVLEVPPKWALLQAVLEEVQQERRSLLSGAEDRQPSSSRVAGSDAGAGPDARFPVLVVTRHESTARQLRRWLLPEEQGGGAALMAGLWHQYLEAWLDSRKAGKGTVAAPGRQAARRAGRGGSGTRGRWGRGRQVGAAAAASCSSVENRMQAAAAGERNAAECHGGCRWSCLFLAYTSMRCCHDRKTGEVGKWSF
mmetsp:Transcript_874/g.2644  ORF Transcript_874/g.2644 Transcript_874/m.2644 type:complete len:566 (-) Transcript_874:35-1732(-)